MAATGESQHHTAIIGSPKNFWLYDSRTGFDLTHPTQPDAPKISPRVMLETTTSPISIDPAKSALVIVDMQNFFLSPALGRARGPGHDAVDQLVKHAIPAAREAGIQILWVNWGLSQQNIDEMPPAVLRAFGFKGEKDGENATFNKHGVLQVQEVSPDGKVIPKYIGLGSDLGQVKDPKTGIDISAGKLLMQDQWNTALFPPLDEIYNKGANMSSRPDAWLHKDRMSGSWRQTPLIEFLETNNIRTLLFSGVNTDQCVNGTLTDCFSKGYDCILLSDACGTTSPNFAQQTVEFNAANTCGFVTTCKALSNGVNAVPK